LLSPTALCYNDPMTEQPTDKVLVTLRKERWQVEPGKTARQIMEELDLNPENFLTMINGQLTDDSTRLKAGDHLKLIAVISGGEHAA